MQKNEWHFPILRGGELLIGIPKGKDKPYQTNKNQFLIRIVSTNRIATQSELMRLFQQSGVFHYDRLGGESTSISDLNMNKIDQYFDNYQMDFLIEENQPQRYLNNASISFAHFSGTTISGQLIDKQVIEGNLDYQVDTTLAVIKNNILSPSIIQG